MILAFTLVGIVLIGVLGFVGRRRPAADLAEWTVGGRRFGALTMWFLQAGEVFTTFTFLGMAGLAFSGGVAAMYALPYVPIAYVVLFFLAKRIWALGKERGYLTQGDFLEDRFSSRALGTVSAVLGVIFVLPYLQLQITGLGLIVRLVTGDTASGNLSMVAGSVLVVAFVLWAGLRGVAATSYFKDAIMLVVLVVLIIAVPAHFAGGVSGVFHKIEQLHPEKLVIHAGANDRTWFVTSMLVSAIGVGLMTLPHTWPALMSARDPKVLRRNYAWMPVYELCLLLPMIIGFAAILVVPRGSDPNGVLLTLSKDALPGWVTGLVVVAATATAMVPAAGILIGISSLVARNIARVRGERRQFWINHGTVVLASALALVLGIFRPDLLANLLLLTYSGSVQLAPANLLGFLKKVPVGKVPVFAGLIAGEVVVIWLTFFDTGLAGTVNVGLIGLAVNLVVLAATAALERAFARPATPEREGEPA
ncbi:sodium:solute symporter family protein [Amycolatopsis sp. PS_44_ISF1]|uniref:sodium:solute symporter family protein n=1 Tax=Amycolatopsis sp. PS_44_ISF1 TaxID=2974917 RepID=UPI0028DFC15A|nr:sodium:solute symporter family protein [Amycolatopsis sp. PS_44_ISF1]MDT8914169.1 sodium:solute symporter family protein [Amycolatopsis sp. PS_44_ISF1]